MTVATTAPSRPTSPDERIEALDAIRGVVLFGVLIVNLVTEFRVSIFQQFLGVSITSGLDFGVERLVSLGIEAKAFCLFALLFGSGLAIQFERLGERGRSLYWLGRRLAVLLAFGLVHLLMIWNGDILVEYALAGLLVLPFLLVRSTGALLVVAAAFLALYTAGPLLLYSVPWPATGALHDHVIAANEAYSTGTWPEVWRFSLGELPLILSLHAMVFPRTIALFVLGMALWRIGVFKHPERFKNATVLAAIAGLVAGTAMTAAEVQRTLSGFGLLADLLAPLTPVVLAMGYGASLLLLAQLPATRRMIALCAPAGRMAFSNYVMQSMVFGLIFFGYGLGRFGRMPAAGAFALGVAVYLAQVAFSTWWLNRYRFGPLEWLWRTLTYGTLQPMLKAQRAA